jgi:hypothetical protein
MILVVQQGREDLVRRLTWKRTFANQRLDYHHSNSKDVRALINRSATQPKVVCLSLQVSGVLVKRIGARNEPCSVQT